MRNTLRRCSNSLVAHLGWHVELVSAVRRTSQLAISIEACLLSNGRHVEDASDPTRLSMVLVSQQVIYLVLDLIGQVFGAFQSGRTVATVILIGIESPKGGNQDCQDYEDCRSHDSSR
jgi:hypothetical protein